jgi:tripartite-type tricarboxylate transporter receptor subunit TctC
VPDRSVLVRIRTLFLAPVVGLALWAAIPAFAQTPVRILVGFPAGGGLDAVARLLADSLEKQTGRPHLVENRAGAGGSLPARALIGAAADGNTLMLAPDSVVLVYPYTVTTPGFNPSTDLAPVARVTSYDFAISVRGGDGGIRSLDALRDAVRHDPKAATIGNPAAGGLLHFYAVAFAKATGLDATHVPYRGVAPAITDAIGGAVAAVITPVGTVLQHATSGRLRILATSGAERGAKTPNVPSIKELGYPQLVSSGWFGMFAPAKTPPDVVRRINESLKVALADPAIHAKLAALDMDAAWNSPQDFRAEIDTQGKTWAAVVKASGFKADQ